MAREEFVSRSLNLLSLERDAELADSENTSGSPGLKSLAVSSQKVKSANGFAQTACKSPMPLLQVGLYGRHVVVFVSAQRARRKSPEKPLPANALTNGINYGVLLLSGLHVLV